MKIVIDSYAWIELFMGSAKGGKVKEILEDADEVYTPDTVLAEIARKYVREGIEERIVNTRCRFKHYLLGCQTIFAIRQMLPGTCRKRAKN